MARPIESFGPELLVALVKGSKEELYIPFPTYRQAIAFRQRINQLRNTMASANHPLYKVAAKARVSIYYGAKAGYDDVPSTRYGFPVDRSVPAKVYIRPQDLEFRDMLKSAGIGADELDDNLLNEINSSTPPPTSSPLEMSGDELLEQILSRSKS